MPTDKNTALRILVRKRKIGEADWLKLIEARRALIKRHLDKFTLSELGASECLNDTGRRTYRLDNKPLVDNREHPKVISKDKELSLKTQGIFCIQPWDKIKYDYPQIHGFPGGIMLIWGLIRSGHWIIVEVRFKGTAGYKHRGRELSETVKIEKTDLATIIARTEEKPIEIWKMLGEAVKKWTEKRKKLYEDTLKINDIIKTENKALSLITFFPIFN